jgi:hypothetical protein
MVSIYQHEYMDENRGGRRLGLRPATAISQ